MVPEERGTNEGSTCISLSSRPAGNSQIRAKEGKPNLAEMRSQKSKRSRQLRFSGSPRKKGAAKGKNSENMCTVPLNVWFDSSCEQAQRPGENNI